MQYSEHIQVNDIKRKIRKYILDFFLFGYQEGFEDNTSFQEDGIIDSTGILELIDYIEREFPIRVENDELIPENIDSLDRLTEFVCRKMDMFF